MGNEHTRTQGQRLKLARVERNWTQQQMADGIQSVTAGKYGSKPSVSKYEADLMEPGHAVLLAYVALTGFAEEWLTKGTGPRKAVLPKLETADAKLRALLLLAIEVACEAHTKPGHIAAASVAVLDTLLEDATVPRSALLRIAKMTSPA